MILAGIDPGPEASALVVLDTGGTGGEWPPSVILARLLPNRALEAELETALQGGAVEFLGIEWLMTYRKVVGQAVFHTCRAVGRFEMLAETWKTPVERLTNVEIRQNLCQTVKCGQPQITLALIERFGGDRARAVGTKKAPGPLYGVKSHLWSALAVAVTLADRLERASKAEGPGSVPS